MKREGWQNDFHTFLEDQVKKEIKKPSIVDALLDRFEERFLQEEKEIEERIKNDQSDPF